jgi:hypothetical protein
MTNKILQDASKMLVILFQQSEAAAQPELWLEGKVLQTLTGFSPQELNDAVDFLHDRGYVDRLDWGGTHPYKFGQVMLTSRGRYAYHDMVPVQGQPTPTEEDSTRTSAIAATPPLPVGSPFGFTDLDWEYVQTNRRLKTTLIVVFGYQFASAHYQADKLRTNLQSSFQRAVDRYNQRGGRDQISLQFRPLAAGYGEHLFNQISRDIISADIAVFDTSDLNPNVMIEMGVALTWGCRVLPIKKLGCPKPPSDISGQTWVDYLDDASSFTNPSHDEDLASMI